jgi:hypothetical protein
MKEMLIAKLENFRKQKTILVIVPGFWLLQWFFWNSFFHIYRLGFLLQDGVYGKTYGIIETLGPNPRLVLGIPFILSSVFVLIGSQFKNAKYFCVISIICLILETVLILVIVLHILSPINRTTFSLS